MLTVVPQTEPSQEPTTEADAPKPKKKGKAPAPVAISKSGRRLGIFENILYHCADDDQFYKVVQIIKLLDPDGSIGLAEEHIGSTIRAMQNHKSVHVDTRPAAHDTFHYRFYKVEKTIGLTVLKARFRPVIEDLKQQAALPISYQTSGRFLAAAGVLIQLLRDLEAE